MKLKNLSIIVFCIALTLSAKGQSQKIIEEFKSTLFPAVGKESNYDISYSTILKEKYNIDFMASKVNELDSGDCVFNTTINGESLTAQLEINQEFPYEVTDQNKKYIAKITYDKYIPNTKDRNASSVVIKVIIYSNDNLLNSDNFKITIPNNIQKNNKATLWATQYYVHQAEYSKNGFPLMDNKEKYAFTKIEICDWCDAAVEGTIFTKDSLGNNITLNYAGKSKKELVNCSKCKKY